MALQITFNNYSLQSTSTITRTVNYRTRAKRNLEAVEIARGIGKKLVNTQIQEKVIEITGIILGNNQSDLQDNIDEFQKYLSAEEGDLVIETDRTYVATAERISIPDRSYTQTMVEFDVQFVCADGFAKGTLQTAETPVPSGTQSTTFTTTVSGTVENRPLFRFIMPSGTGVCPINAVTITNGATGNYLTVSGSFSRLDQLVVDFENFAVTLNGTDTDYVGAMDTINPGSNSFTVTISGSNEGSRCQFAYQPRYW